MTPEPDKEESEVNPMRHGNLLEALRSEFALTEVLENSYLANLQADGGPGIEIQLICSTDYISIGIPFADVNDIQAHKVLQATMNSPFGISVSGNGKYIIKHLIRNQSTTLEQFKKELSMIVANIQLWSAGETK